MGKGPQIVQPAPGSPRWIAATEHSELVYLSWGQRDFFRHPIKEHRNPGWSYVVINEGTVRFDQAGTETALEKSQALLIAPGCTHAFRHERGEQCKVLTWIFRSGSSHPELVLDKKSFLLCGLEPTALQFVEHLHIQSREEITRIQALFESSITQIRELLDIQLVRSLQQPRRNATHDLRLERARQWMNCNLELTDPVRSLCNYLQVSQSTLYRLFQKAYNRSPREVHHQLRLTEAQRLIEQEGWQVKQAAYRLGYRHPCDLSRALSQFQSKHICKP